MLNQRGSVMVEGTIGVVVFCAMMSGVFFLSYFAFVRVWIDKQSYEALVCLGSLSQTYDCESKLRNSVETALPIGKLSKLRLSRSDSRAEIQAQFTIGESHVFYLENSLNLPLSGSKRFW